MNKKSIRNADCLFLSDRRPASHLKKAELTIMIADHFKNKLNATHAVRLSVYNALLSTKSNCLYSQRCFRGDVIFWLSSNVIAVHYPTGDAGTTPP